MISFPDPKGKKRPPIRAAFLWVQDPHGGGKLVDIDQFMPEGGPGAIFCILKGMGPKQLSDGIQEVVGSEMLHLVASYLL